MENVRSVSFIFFLFELVIMIHLFVATYGVEAKHKCVVVTVPDYFSMLHWQISN